MMVISDVDDVFVPLPDDLLVNLSESRNVVDSFLDSLPTMFQDTMNVESAFGPALKAALLVMVCDVSHVNETSTICFFFSQFEMQCYSEVAWKSS